MIHALAAAERSIKNAMEHNVHLKNRADAAIAFAMAQGSRPGLERIRELLVRLGNPQDAIPVVHVAGTNGKGSTCAFIESILRSAGYKTGLFSSPFLVSPTEMFCIDGKPISEDELYTLVVETTAAAEGMCGLSCGAPTEFELYTAMAFNLFVRTHCQIVILETGMGGLLDATNVCSAPVLSVITRISLEHQAFLGDDLVSIAKHKAGILRNNGLAIFGPQETEVTEYLNEVADSLHVTVVPETSEPCRLLEITPDAMRFLCAGFGEVSTSLLGLHQMENASVALRATMALQEKGWVIDKQQMLSGLLSARWACRFEVLSTKSITVIDSAHNPDGMRTFVDTFQRVFPNMKAIVLFGVMRDKDVKKMLEMLKPITAQMILVEPNHQRALPMEELYHYAKQTCENVHKSDTIKKAVALGISIREAHQAVVAVGSIYYVGSARQMFLSRENE